MWLFTIATRRCATWRRRTKKDARPLGENDLVQLVDGDQSAQEALIARELQSRVRAAIARLPAKQREAIVLFEIEGWKVTDIAAALECAPATVKVHLHRARLRLRSQLADYVADDPKAEVATHDMPTCQAAHPRVVE
jgi:RNA polymerase sigma-70 factor (ECF subfamily)